MAKLPILHYEILEKQKIEGRTEKVCRKGDKQRNKQTETERLRTKTGDRETEIR